jgi:F-type H+-transporting ATPase subunit gamma
MRKAQERMRHARPYGEKIRNVAAHISHANPSTGIRSWWTATR